MSPQAADELLTKIRSRGHWEISIRPARFTADRIPYAELEGLVSRSAVQLRGWDFPHIDVHEGVFRGADWVGQGSAWNYHLEVWRFYASGLFAIVRAFWKDWTDEDSFVDPGRRDGGRELTVGDALFTMTEVFEFAARLSLTAAGDDRMHISITARDLAGRALVVGDRRRAEFVTPRIADVSEFPQTFDLATDDLVARSREFAIDASIELFMRFGWLDAPRESLVSMQDELRGL